MTSPHRATLTGTIPALDEEGEPPAAPEQLDSGEVALPPTERLDF
jgi:aspartate ammonia-lyase